MWTAGCPQYNLFLGFFAKAIFRKKFIKIEKKNFVFFIVLCWSYISWAYLDKIWSIYLKNSSYSKHKMIGTPL